MTINRNHWKRIGAFTLCLCLLMTLTGCSPESNYNKANQLLAEGKYTEAAEKFEALGSFEDAPMLTMYAKASAAGESGQFEACLQTFETLGDFKDSPMMVTYYTARAYEAQGLAAQTPQQQATQESWVALMTAAQGYGEQLLFRDSQQRQQTCYQAVYDMAEGMAAAELFSAARDAHNNLAYIPYQDSYDLGNYYAARHLEATAPQGILYEEQWVAEDFEKYQKAIGIYGDYPHVRDSQTRAEACRQAVYSFAMECAAHEDYTNACAIMSNASGHPDEDKLSAYWGACYLEQTDQYDLAAQRFEIYADFAPEGGDTGAVRAEAARQNGYNAAMALLEEGKYDDGYTLLRSLGDYNDATNFIPQHEFQRAQAHLDAGEYEAAIDLFKKIDLQADVGKEPGYTPELGEAASLKARESFYYYGEALFAAAKTEEAYENARRAFQNASNYAPEGGVPAVQRYQSLWYERGESLLDQEQPDYEGAREAFSKAGSYAPEGEMTGTERNRALWYQEGEQLFAAATTETDYVNAQAAFEKAVDYTPEGGVPAVQRYKSLWYERGESLLDQEQPDYEGAREAFSKAGSYAPEGKMTGTERNHALWYQEGEQLFATATTETDYANAQAAFEKAVDYTPEGGVPAPQRYTSLWYERGEALLAQESPDYDGAKAAFEAAGDYAPEGGVDAPNRVKECWYRIGEALLAQDKPRYRSAKAAFDAAGEYADSAEKSIYCSNYILNLTYVSRFSSGMAVVKNQDGQMGYIDQHGDVLVPFGLWDELRTFSDGRALVGKKTENGVEYAFIDTNGNIIVELEEYAEIWPYRDGRAMVMNDAGHYGYLDVDGNLVIPFGAWDGARSFSEGLACVTKSKKSGYIDLNGQQVIPSVYTPGTTGDFKPDGFAYAEKDDQKFYIDRQGNTYSVAEVEAKRAGDSRFYYYSSYKTVGFKNSKGELVIPPDDWSYAGNFQEGIAIVYNGNQCGAIDATGKYVIPLGIYQSIGYGEGLFTLLTQDGQLTIVSLESLLAE